MSRVDCSLGHCNKINLYDSTVQLNFSNNRLQRECTVCHGFVTGHWASLPEIREFLLISCFASFSHISLIYFVGAERDITIIKSLVLARKCCPLFVCSTYNFCLSAKYNGHIFISGQVFHSAPALFILCLPS